MNRNDLLKQIVQSAEEEMSMIGDVAKQTLDKEASFPSDNPSAVQSIPHETIKVVEDKLMRLAGKTDARIPGANTTPSKPGEHQRLNMPNIRREQGLPFEKLASEEGLVAASKQEAMLMKEASAIPEDEMDAALMKIATEIASEFQDLEKVAEEFGAIAAQRFLEEILGV